MSKPASLRAIWTAWTISRARPSRKQLLVELERQRDRVPRLGLHLVAVERLQGEGQVVGLERVVGAVDRDPDLTSLGQYGGDVGGVERLDRGRDLGHPLAEAGAEGAVVGLRRVADQLGLVADEVQLLDVELGGDELGAGFDRRPLGTLATITGAAQRLGTFAFAWARAARPSSTVSRTASIARLEVGIGEPGVDRGEVAQVDGVGQPARLPSEPPARLRWISSARKG